MNEIRPVRSLLIANRGEIACRIAATCRRLGVRTVLAASAGDARSAAARVADEVALLPGSTPNQSYLDSAAIIAAARHGRVDAIHPGYGFLSENAAFAQACLDNGLIFIGPHPAGIAQMGDKAKARALMHKAGVPLLAAADIPAGTSADDPALLEALHGMGLPLLLKPVAGGGGKGMHVVEDATDLRRHIEQSRHEAMNAFGQADLIAERYVPRARHVEVQVFGDASGSILVLGDRDCSSQRRYQKILEEAPAPNVPDDVRAALWQVAREAARTIDYVGAGTVEFLLEENGQFWFMEMNTRLQVEHPVTEMITGIDLVEWQIAVAEGRPLPLAQHEIPMNGHAAEVRLCAERPQHDFLPAAGHVAALHLPCPADRVRIDSGLSAGDQIGMHFDPMLMKVIAHGDRRDDALTRLRDALGEVAVAGVATNRDFLLALIDDPDFRSCRLDIHGLGTMVGRFREQSSQADPFTVAVAAISVMTVRQASDADPWHRLTGYRNTGAAVAQARLLVDEQPMDIRCELEAPDRHLLRGRAQAEGTDGQAAFRLQVRQRSEDVHEVVGSIGTRSVRYLALRNGADLTLADARRSHEVCIDTGQGAAAGAAADQQADGRLRAPMSGRLIKVAVAAGDNVVAGQMLLALEAMKMEHAVCAPCPGRIVALHGAEGELVESGSLLVEMEAEA